ncbi:hypothetical protein [Streptomyces sp. NPDC090022]|uniref:hypothetical protein n=1 Tax=Streptomyces sp. NPDC090022 TaxID=3365920 RepID=UPI0038063DA1
MHSYDPSRAPSFPSPTPIYDALYSEYLRAFRALPGDRTGEEDLGFTAFGPYGAGHSAATGSSVSGWNGSAWQTEPWQTTYAAPQIAPPPQPLYAVAAVTAGGSGYGGGRQHQTGTHHVPAALPPAPRRGY